MRGMVARKGLGDGGSAVKKDGGDEEDANVCL